jgi:hypothetical protein
MSETPVPWTVQAQSRNVHTVRFPLRSVEDEQWFLLSSDRHHDNAHTDQALERKHLEQAKERGAGIIDVGDMHCAMQGKWDKRADRSALRPEYQRGEYLDSLVQYASEFYAPFAANFVVVGRGNHETAITKRHETDLTERTCERMTHIGGHKVHPGGYGGWVRLIAECGPKRRRELRIKYFHGSGGGGPVTRGVIQTNRMAVYLPDADLVVTGHTHDHWIVPIARERISRNGIVSMDEQTHVRIGCYKDEYADGHGGWHIERGGPPKPIGACWLRVYQYGGRRQLLGYEVTRAV